MLGSLTYNIILFFHLLSSSYAFGRWDRTGNDERKD